MDETGTVWLHTYLVWPDLTIYVTISGPPGGRRNYRKLGDPRNQQSEADNPVMIAFKD
jgi:hypothetical protein